jgi:hypothetical protein
MPQPQRSESLSRWQDQYKYTCSRIVNLHVGGGRGRRPFPGLSGGYERRQDDPVERWWYCPSNNWSDNKLWKANGVTFSEQSTQCLKWNL